MTRMPLPAVSGWRGRSLVWRILWQEVVALVGFNGAIDGVTGWVMEARTAVGLGGPCDC